MATYQSVGWGWGLARAYSVLPRSQVFGCFSAPSFLLPVPLQTGWPHAECLPAESQRFPPVGEIPGFQSTQTKPRPCRTPGLFRRNWFCFPRAQPAWQHPEPVQKPRGQRNPALRHAQHRVPYTRPLPGSCTGAPSRRGDQCVGAAVTAPGHLLPLSLARPPGLTAGRYFWKIFSLHK